MTLATLSAFQDSLLIWFEEHQRPLPWRVRYEPYEVWISEIMLQQTRIQMMLPYYRRWMEALPDLQKVAEVNEEKLMKLWEGLGYYRRARNAKKTAVILCTEQDGRIPGNVKDLIRLPGIGRYTAGAIASIGFNRPEPVLDGNVTRVICRLLNIREHPHAKETRKRLWQLSHEWIPEGRARWFNQALMELGATICLPLSPTCRFCPVQEHCHAYGLGTVKQIPKPIQTPSIYLRHRACAVIHSSKHLLFLKRTGSGLFEGLWEFPSVEANSSRLLRKSLQEHVQREIGCPINLGKEIHHLEHRYTTFRTRVGFYYGTTEGFYPNNPESMCWVAFSKIEDYALPAPYRRFLRWFMKEGSGENT